MPKQAKHSPIQETIASQAKAKPNSIAVIGPTGEDNDKITYYELMERANAVAQRLRKFGIGQSGEESVGVLVERSIDYVVSLLAVFLSGGICMPIDPTASASTTQHILNDSDTKVLMIHSATKPKVPRTYVEKVFKMDGVKVSTKTNNKSHTLPVDMDQVCYLLYISNSIHGSLGVLLEHNSLADALDLYADMTGQQEAGKVSLICSNLGSRSAMLEVFGGLRCGGTLVLFDNNKNINNNNNNNNNNNDNVVDTIQKNNVSISCMAVPMLQEINPVDVPTLQTVIVFVGAKEERCSVSLVKKWNDANRRIVNAYGPVQATALTSWKVIDSEDDVIMMTIGRAAKDIRYHIVDRAGKPVADTGDECTGIVGELWIEGSSCHARGYHNMYDLSTTTFEDPARWLLIQDYNQVVRSGDLVRWLPDDEVGYVCELNYKSKLRVFKKQLDEVGAVAAVAAEAEKKYAPSTFTYTATSTSTSTSTSASKSANLIDEEGQVDPAFASMFAGACTGGPPGMMEEYMKSALSADPAGFAEFQSQFQSLGLGGVDEVNE